MFNIINKCFCVTQKPLISLAEADNSTCGRKLVVVHCSVSCPTAVTSTRLLLNQLRPSVEQYKDAIWHQYPLPPPPPTFGECKFGELCDATNSK